MVTLNKFSLTENRKLHLKSSYDIILELIPEEGTCSKLKNTVLYHDIGYSNEAAFENSDDHNLKGYLFWQGKNVVHEKAILFHSRFSEVILTCEDIDVLATYIVDYCDIHSGPQGQRVSIDERIDEIGKRYGEDSLVYTVMNNRRDYYKTLDVTILEIIKLYKKQLLLN